MQFVICNMHHFKMEGSQNDILTDYAYRAAKYQEMANSIKLNNGQLGLLVRLHGNDIIYAYIANNMYITENTDFMKFVKENKHRTIYLFYYNCTTDLIIAVVQLENDYIEDKVEVKINDKSISSSGYYRTSFVKFCKTTEGKEVNKKLGEILFDDNMHWYNTEKVIDILSILSGFKTIIGREY